jgi:hypothetical protein
VLAPRQNVDVKRFGSAVSRAARVNRNQMTKSDVRFCERKAGYDKKVPDAVGREGIGLPSAAAVMFYLARYRRAASSS